MIHSHLKGNTEMGKEVHTTLKKFTLTHTLIKAFKEYTEQKHFILIKSFPQPVNSAYKQSNSFPIIIVQTIPIPIIFNLGSANFKESRKIV
jgi:hypothetical protein